MILPALDTNILAYAEGVERSPGDRQKILISQRLLESLLDSGTRPVIPAQALAELHHVLVRKAGISRIEATSRVKRLMLIGQPVATDDELLNGALELATARNLRIYDAIILQAATLARCDLLISEDFQEGFGSRGVTVTNPFSSQPDPRIAALLA